MNIDSINAEKFHRERIIVAFGLYNIEYEDAEIDFERDGFVNFCKFLLDGQAKASSQN